MEESLALSLKTESPEAIGSARDGLGLLALEEGDYATARELFQPDPELDRRLNLPFDVAVNTGRLARVAHAEGDWVTARRLYEEALVGLQAVGGQLRSVALRTQLGLVEWQIGNDHRAAALFAESLAHARLVGHQEWIPLALIGLAGVRLRQDADTPSTMQAVQWLGAAAMRQETMGLRWYVGDRHTHEEILAASRARLAEPIWSAAWEAGRTMPLEQAIAEALGEIERPSLTSGEQE
jgi:hypothetical protein